MARPPGVVWRLAQYVVEMEPGGFSQSDIAKKVYKMLVDEVGDRQLVKSIASADKDCYGAAAGGVGGEEGVNLSSSLAKQYMCNVM